MCIYKTVYTVYTSQYTWKVTDKDIILSKTAGLQLTAVLKKCAFSQVFLKETLIF